MFHHRSVPLFAIQIACAKQPPNVPDSSAVQSLCKSSLQPMSIHGSRSIVFMTVEVSEDSSADEHVPSVLRASFLTWKCC